MLKDASLQWAQGHLLKILSLVTAFFFWFYVVNSEPITIKRTYHIKVKSPVGLNVDEISDRSIDVTLKGARAFLKDYQDQSLYIYVDMSKAPIKRNTKFKYRLKDNDIHLPFGVDVVSMNPEVISLNFDRVIKKEVAVRPTLVGQISSDLKMMSYSITPKKVMISGPRSIMKKIGIINTRTIDISDLSGQGEKDVFLEVAPEFINYELEDSTQKSFKFNYDIRPKKANVTLKNISIKFITSSQRFKPSTLKVSLDVLAVDHKSIRKSEIEVYADVPEEKKGNFSVQLRANLPDGVHLLKIHPEQINIKKY